MTIQPIVATRCAGCHSKFGTAANRPFDDHARVFTHRAAVSAQVSSCRMPPASAPQLEPGERAALLEWLACGAPDN